MKLIELVRNLDTLDERSTIFASRPWVETSEAIVAYEPESDGMPAEAKRLGLLALMTVCSLGTCR
jgi:hypothetical protein